MNPTAHISKPVIGCAVCNKRGIWFASCHIYRPSERVQLFAEGASLWTVPGTLVAPVCSPACANEVALVFDCPILDKNFQDLHGFLKKWREQQKRQGKAA